MTLRPARSNVLPLCYRCGRQPCACADGITLYHSDCRDVLPLLEPGSVDLTYTDPPYGVGKAEWDGCFAADWMGEAARVSEVVAVMPGISNIAKLPQCIGVLQYQWTLAAHLVNGMTHGPFGYGNWIACLVYANESRSLYNKTSDAARITVGREAKPRHPSPKPCEAVKWMLAVLPGGLTLDPFAGSGTTGRACKDLGRKCIMVEIERKYCDIIVERLRQEVLF